MVQVGHGLCAAYEYCTIYKAISQTNVAARRFPRSGKRDGPRVVVKPDQLQRSLLLVGGEAASEHLGKFGAVNCGDDGIGDDNRVLSVEAEASVGEVGAASPGELAVEDRELVVHQARQGV